MAQYCEPEDLGRYGVNAEALADLSIPEQIIPAINAASDIIDSYLRSRFELPLSDWGTDLRACCAVLAAWEALRVRGIKPGENPEDNALYLAQKEKLAWLRQVGGGTAHPEVTDSSSGASAGVTTASRPMVSSNEQRGWYTRDGAGGPFTGRRQS